ncbi:aldose epimerase family protein [Pseudonocardia acaciae]|uniref:aldose epimerase family protein n=1 Tax=Pseudonocardia acaciae TaxID=551276 RepID=UPI000567FA55|nr:aldose epimerase family protein [Pseudonocardia acaciae]
MIESTREDDATVVTISNEHCTAVLTDLGARLLELHVPDRDGALADVVLGRPTLAQSATDPNYMGSTAGRYANRIRDGRFVLDGTPHQLTRNEGRNHLHGGERGFDRQAWRVTTRPDRDEVTFHLVSPDGDEGYPGTLTTSVTYRLTGPALDIEIEATTDRATVVNIVHHSYFNLGGADSGSVLDHLLWLNSSFYTPVDDELLPTGEVLAVAGTPFDFRTPTPIGKHLHEVQRTSDRGAGYDHNWVLAGTGMREVATVEDPRSGRRMAMSTDQPGVQVYVGGYLDGVTAKPPLPEYRAFAGLTFEAQTFPDSVNHSHFPQPVLRPGQAYRNRSRFEFSTVAPA